MWRKSTAVDKYDYKELQQRWAEHRRAAVSGASESCPFFFTREGIPITLEGTLRNAAAFLIGGGPSFAMVEKFKLDHVWTMTLNNASFTYRGDATCMVDDPSRFSLSVWLDPKIQKFVPFASFGKPLWDNRLLPAEGTLSQRWHKSTFMVYDCPNVIGFQRNERFEADRFLYEETINWGCHAKFGGGRSVMLPALRILFLLGFRRVYLLGVDFEMTEEHRYHFPEDRSPAAIRANIETYAKLEKWFTELQPYFLKENFVVKNCNPKSKLEAFPFLPLDEAISEATDLLGRYVHEQTRGMYKSIQEKEIDVTRRSPRDSRRFSPTHRSRMMNGEPNGCTEFKALGKHCAAHCLGLEPSQTTLDEINL